MNKQPKTIYREVEIAYDENSNRWKFELYGRERTAATLTLAKQAIDAPPPKDKSKVFARFQAYKKARYGKGIETVTVTSVAESTYGNGVEFWATNGSKGREKLGIDELFKINKANDERLALIKELEKGRDQLYKRIEVATKALENIDAPPKE